MICLRCSYCCIMYDVIVPLSGTQAAYKPAGKRCWNLAFVEEKAICKIHNKSFYKNSPCSQHTQIEERSTACRTGVYMLGEGQPILKEFKRYNIAVPTEVFDIGAG